eukprot:gene13408-4273_t
MAVAEDINFKIEKLTGKNYHNWKFQMKMYLFSKDLWEIVTGTEVLDEIASAQEQLIFKKRESGLGEHDLLVVSNSNANDKCRKEAVKSKVCYGRPRRITLHTGDIHRNRAAKTLMIKQSKSLEIILKKFDMKNCKLVSTPLEPGRRFVKLHKNVTPVDVQRYQMATGCSMYAATVTQPDIAAAVGVLSQFMSHPSKMHWQGIKPIFRYIKGTVSYGLRSESFSKMNSSLLGYSDADWGGDSSTRKSTSGYLFKICG